MKHLIFKRPIHIGRLICLTLIFCFSCSDLDPESNEVACDEVTESFFSPSNRTFILPVNGEGILTFCERTIPENIEGYFDLSFDRICQVQNNLLEVIPILESTCYEIDEVPELDKYFYQFLGLTINQTEYIYINAFIPIINSAGTSNDWETFLIDSCGGGSNYWGALMNLNNGEFSYVEFNQNSNYAVLDPSPETEIRLCTRCLGFKDHSYFALSNAEICLMKDNFEKLKSVRAKTCNSVGFGIFTTGSVFHQYIGVVIDGRKFIYINGFSFNLNDLDGFYNTFMAYCDGGRNLWGVLFDLETTEFSNLQFNGVR